MWALRSVVMVVGLRFSAALAQQDTGVVSQTAYDIQRACRVYDRVKMQIRDDAVPVRAQDALDYGFCGGYILGVGDSIAATRSACIPSGVHNDAVVQVVLKHLNDHPEELHLAASSVVSEGLRKAYPCK